jgi:prolyl oligopeptidase
VQVLYVFQSFLHPPTVHRHALRSGRSEVYRWMQIDFDPNPFVTEQRFFTSRDGTPVPMFVTHRRDLPREGRNPTFMVGYGGGGIP